MDKPLLATTDVQGLNSLKALAHSDEEKALPEVAKQFESVFLQAMVKAMRASDKVLSEDNPFHSESVDTFQEMLDGQFVSNISSGKGIGMAEMLVKQLSKVAPPPVTHETAPTAQVAHPLPVMQQIKAQEPAAKEPAMIPKGIKDFVKSIMPYARQAAKVLGLDPKILVAQAALETGWGKYVARDSDGTSSNNLFNIKAQRNSNQPSVQIKTTEFLAGTPLKISDSFKKYNTVGDSFNDYINMIKQNDRYQEAKDNAANPERFVNALHKAGYATDPLYVKKILTIYHSEDLNNALEEAQAPQEKLAEL